MRLKVSAHVEITSYQNYIRGETHATRKPQFSGDVRVLRLYLNCEIRILTKTQLARACCYSLAQYEIAECRRNAKLDRRELSRARMRTNELEFVLTWKTTTTGQRERLHNDDIV